MVFMMAAGSISTFSYPASDEEAEVDAIVSQAIDLCALEHISKLNSAHLHDEEEDSSSLPTELEARFRKLKSFPFTKPRCLDRHTDKENDPTTPQTPSLLLHHRPTKEEDEEEEPKKPEVPHEAETTCATKPEGEEVVETNSKREPSPSPSPPKQACCFGFSPNKKKKKKKNKWKGDGVGGGWEMDEEYWRVNDEMLSDLRTLSLKEQRRNLKRVVKEQEKASREAEKLVQWVRQASARMEVAALDELPSDEDEKL